MRRRQKDSKALQFGSAKTVELIVQRKPAVSRRRYPAKGSMSILDKGKKSLGIIEIRFAVFGTERQPVLLEKQIIRRLSHSKCVVSPETDRIHISAHEFRHGFENLVVGRFENVDSILLRNLQVRWQTRIRPPHDYPIGDAFFVPVEDIAWINAGIFANYVRNMGDGEPPFIRKPAEIPAGERSDREIFSAGEFPVEMEKKW